MSGRLGNGIRLRRRNFAALENIKIARTQISLRKTLNIISKPQLKRVGLYGLKQHKPCFDEECLCFLDQRKQAKMQWVQDPSQSYVDNRS